MLDLSRKNKTTDEISQLLDKRAKSFSVIFFVFAFFRFLNFFVFFLLHLLKSLYLGFNQLTRLPVIPVPFLRCITSLFLSDNSIDRFPKELGTLTSLVWLDLSHNILSNVAGVEDLTSLRQLFCSNNQIRELPQYMKKLTALHHLDFAGNMLPSCFNVEIATLEATQHHLEEVSSYYERLEATRAAICQLVLIFRLKKQQQEWWWMPPEILYHFILPMIWSTRHEAVWNLNESLDEDKGELEVGEDFILPMIWSTRHEAVRNPNFPNESSDEDKWELEVDEEGEWRADGGEE